MQQEGSRVLERRPLQSQQLLAVAGGRLSMEVGSVDLDHIVFLCFKFKKEVEAFWFRSNRMIYISFWSSANSTVL